MALKFNFFNIIQFFTFLSPIIISSFLVLQSAMNFDIKAVFWLIGSCLAWFIGMLIKSGFHAMELMHRIWLVVIEDAQEDSG